MPIKFNSLSSKTILPVIAVFMAGIAALIVFIPQINKQRALDTAINNATETIYQYKTLRSYYTKNVISKINSQSNLQATFDHKIRKKAVPLPATLILELGDLLSKKKGLQIRLYSAFPFPGRKDRKLDDFAVEALEYFKTNPDDAFVKTDLSKGNEIVRVAIADKMVAQSCVACHNTHPQTPKRGWKMGDVRGALEVIVPISAQMASGREVSFIILTIIGLMFAFIIAAILFFFNRSINRPIKAISHMSLQVAQGNLDADISIKSNDEMGELTRNLNKMRVSINGLFDELYKSKVETEESNSILRESEARISTILKTAADGIVTVNETGIVESFNPTAERMFNYEADEVVGNNISMLMPFSSWGNQAQYWQTEGAAGNDDNREVVGKKKDGSIFTIDLAVSKASFAGKTLFTAIIRDITERKRAEEILKDYNKTLENEVSLRSKDLSNAIENLQVTQTQLVEVEKMATLGGLVAGVTHEVNTPLGISVTLSSLFNNETEALIKAYKNNNLKRSDLEKYMETISQSSSMLASNLNRAAELIQSFKQVAVDQSIEEKRAFALKKYLTETLLSLQPKLKRTNIRVDIVGDETISLRSYPGVFTQIVTNLIVNSLNHAYDPDDHGCVVIDFRREGSSLIFNYSDDGQGISDENRAKIFEPFFTTKRGKGGTGLGLHIIHNLVAQKLGGTISCESEKGKGSKFIITVPIEPVG